MTPERPWVESLVACVPDGLAFARADWTLIWMNRELARLLAREESPRGTAIDSLVEGWPTVAAQAEATPPGAPRASVTANLVRADGQRLRAQLSIARCAEGVDAAWSIHVRDLSDIGELQRRLSDRERSHSFLQANTSDLIVRTDNALVIGWSNEAAKERFPAGRALEDSLDAESVARLRQTCRAGAEVRTEVVLRSHGDIRPAFQLRGIARRIRDEQEQPAGLSMILRDDSDQLRLQRFAERHDLSPREVEILEYLAQGYSNLNIAAILGLSESGVKFHVRNVFGRAKVGTRTELMAMLLAD